MVLKLIKTYRIKRDTYLFNCDFTIENLTNTEKKIRFMNDRVALNVRLGDLLELAVEKAELQLDGSLKETV